MSQMLLFPDARPLVERLGLAFFREAPEGAGVYLMQDNAGTVLYVGKAKNLRKRLASYRVANPDRLPRRHLRLLRAVARIELLACPDEASALAKEAEFLRNLRPRFNRAGTWPAPPRFLGWRVTPEGLQLAVAPTLETEWQQHGPLGGGATILRAALARLLWCVLQAEKGLAGLPEGWFSGRLGPIATIPREKASTGTMAEAEVQLRGLFMGQVEPFTTWVRDRTAQQTARFESAGREADLETVGHWR